MSFSQQICRSLNRHVLISNSGYVIFLLWMFSSYFMSFSLLMSFFLFYVTSIVNHYYSWVPCPSLNRHVLLSIGMSFSQYACPSLNCHVLLSIVLISKCYIPIMNVLLFFHVLPTTHVLFSPFYLWIPLRTIIRDDAISISHYIYVLLSKICTLIWPCPLFLIYIFYSIMNNYYVWCHSLSSDVCTLLYISFCWFNCEQLLCLVYMLT